VPPTPNRHAEIDLITGADGNTVGDRKKDGWQFSEQSRDAENAENRRVKILLCEALRSLRCNDFGVRWQTAATTPLSSARQSKFLCAPRSAMPQLRQILRRSFYEETRNPRIIGMKSWFPGFLMEMFLVAAWPRYVRAKAAWGFASLGSPGRRRVGREAPAAPSILNIRERARRGRAPNPKPARGN